MFHGFNGRKGNSWFCSGPIKLQTFQGKHEKASGGFYFGECLHDQLCVVVAKARQQVPGSPLQEVVKGVAGTLLHLDLVAVAPDLQAGQRHADVQRPVELKQEEEAAQVGSAVTADGPTGTGSVRSHPVHLVGHVQQAVDDGLVVPLVVQELRSRFTGLQLILFIFKFKQTK